MFKENDTVVVKGDHPDKRIVAGQIGAVVCCFTTPNEAYEVEFVDESGATVAQRTFLPEELEEYGL